MRALMSIAFVLAAGLVHAQTPQRMQLNAGIITEKLSETKAFYTNTLGFGVSFESDFYLLMHTPTSQQK